MRRHPNTKMPHAPNELKTNHKAMNHFDRSMVAIIVLDIYLFSLERLAQIGAKLFKQKGSAFQFNKSQFCFLINAAYSWSMSSLKLRSLFYFVSFAFYTSTRKGGNDRTPVETKACMDLA